MKRKGLLFGLLLSLCFIFISSFLLMDMYRKASAKEKAVMLTISNHSVKSVELTQKSWQQTIVIGGIGDILLHDWIYDDAKTTNGYDFSPALSPVADMLRKPDLLTANQETVPGGIDLGLSSYPMFNSPHEIIDALQWAGVDIISTANNHSIDKGEKGVLASINYFNKVGMPYTGSFKDSKDQQTIRVLSSKGIKCAFLSYTYGTNGIPVPQGKDYLVNLINETNITNEIQRAKNLADVIIVSMHWGNEYQRLPSPYQKELAQKIIDAGANIIFGSHPHVLQPMEWISSQDGRQGLVVYSLGNFISGQMWDYKDIGGMATVNVTKTVNDKGVQINLSEPHFHPTFVSNDRFRNYRVNHLINMTNKEKETEILDHMFQWMES